jgi:glutamyl-tRNA synthetase
MDAPRPSASRPVRVRLAPSPTGYLHIGHAFLAVVNAAFVQQQGGSFVLRIEDTDQQRFVGEAEQAVYDGLHWLGLQWDEGPDVGGPFAPYRQSERLEMYQAAAEELIARGRAYRCWCSPERLDRMRKEQQARKQPPKYDRLCLGKTEAERKRLDGYTDRSVIRLLMPSEGQTSFEDLLRGTITFENALLDDRVLIKSDGFPTYNMAAPFDDHAMEITHITRGADWIPSTIQHLALFDAFGWEPPVMVHTPLLLNADKGKISKRRDPWAKVSWFQEQGYLPEATVNYLGGLAVHVPDPDNPVPGVDKDVFGFDEIVQHLSLEKIGPAGKIIDLDRLGWLSGQYIRRLPLPELEARVLPYMRAAGLDVAGDPRFPAALALEQERLRKLSDAAHAVSFFFRDEPYDPKLLIPKGLDRAQAIEALRAGGDVLETLAAGEGTWTPAALESAFRALAERLGIRNNQLFGSGVMRVAITGRTAGPPLFETMEVLGPETVQRRVDAALQALEAGPAGA